MRVGARAGLRAGAVLVLVGALSACTSLVRSGASEREADALVLALDDSAIAATKERARGRESYEVHVASAELATALRVVRDSGAAQVAQPSFAELYGEPSLVPTPSEERIRFAHATAGELARSIEQLPNVAHARVHLSPPEPRQLLDAPASAWRASLIVQRRAGSAPLDEETLRSLVSGAVEPLPHGNVAVAQTELAPVRITQWVRLGPFTVSKRDAPALRATLGLLLALNALLAVALIAVVARRRARELT